MKIKLIKSGIGRSYRVKRTLLALGLNKINKIVEIDEKNKAHLGMYQKVRFLLEVVE